MCSLNSFQIKTFSSWMQWTRFSFAHRPLYTALALTFTPSFEASLYCQSGVKWPWCKWESGSIACFSELQWVLKHLAIHISLYFEKKYSLFVHTSLTSLSQIPADMMIRSFLCAVDFTGSIERELLLGTVLMLLPFLSQVNSWGERSVSEPQRGQVLWGEAFNLVCSLD